MTEIDIGHLSSATQVGEAHPRPNDSRHAKNHRHSSISLVQQIKERVSLYDVASMLNIDLPKRAGIKFRSPFRPDKDPSCSIYQRRNEWRFRDWSHGIDVDQIGFYALGSRKSNAEAIHNLAQHVGVRTEARSDRKIPSFSDARRLLTPSAPERPAGMPTHVGETWHEGVKHLAGNVDWQRRMAQWRGWTPEVVAQLVEDSMMGTPLYKSDRVVAFRVDYPVVKDLGCLEGGFARNKSDFTCG